MIKVIKANNYYEDQPIVQPPSSAQVTADKRIVLYDSNGTPLVRKIGYAKS